jgi:hypothetical protein
MPTHDRNNHGKEIHDEHPDTKIPRAILPDIDGGYTKEQVVKELNNGKHDSKRYYTAIAKLAYPAKYVLFYREIGGKWKNTNTTPLKPSFDDSLEMLDTSRSLHKLVEGLIGISQSGKGRKRRTRSRTRRRRKTHRHRRNRNSKNKHKRHTTRRRR